MKKQITISVIASTILTATNVTAFDRDAAMFRAKTGSFRTSLELFYTLSDTPHTKEDCLVAGKLPLVRSRLRRVGKNSKDKKLFSKSYIAHHKSLSYLQRYSFKIAFLITSIERSHRTIKS